jgi:hypothetical protein
MIGLHLNNADQLNIETRESAKYIESCDTILSKDTLKLFPKTTTVFNPFSKKHWLIVIKIPTNVRFFRVAGKLVSLGSTLLRR